MRRVLLVGLSVVAFGACSAPALTVITNETVTTDGQPFHGGDTVYVRGELKIQGAAGSLVGSGSQVVLRTGSTLYFSLCMGESREADE